MYYSNGNYEAFARPRKPEGVDEKSAYLVGSGLASLFQRSTKGPIGCMGIWIIYKCTRKLY